MDGTGETNGLRTLDVDEIADTIESIGFECTRCGDCCRGHEGEHTATVSPAEVRALRRSDEEWKDVARPVPFGLTDGEGETFEWALQTDRCGDCVFFDDGGAQGTCSVYDDRPRICRTYPFSLEVNGTEPYGAVVDRQGPVRVHECEGLGRPISRKDAEALARSLIARVHDEIKERRAVLEQYRPIETAPGEVVVHDSEGAKRPDGRPYEGA